MRILLVCGCGISTTILARKIKSADSTLDIKVSTATDAKNSLFGVDVILLAPQVAYTMQELSSATETPIVILDINDFRTMNVQNIICQIKNR